MQVKQITVNFGRTQNTGNFNSIRADVSLTADLDEHDNFAVVLEDLRMNTRAEVIDIIRSAKETYAQDWPVTPR